MDDTVKVIALKFPIKRIENGKETAITSVTVSRLKIKHLKLIPGSMMKMIDGGNSSTKKKNIFSMSEIPDLVPLMAGITGLSLAETEELDLVDMMTIAGVLGDLLGK